MVLLLFEVTPCIVNYALIKSDYILHLFSFSQTLALPDKPSIAVLAFDNLSGNPDQEYFADGISEDLITALSRIRWLFVTSRNSTFAYKGRSPDVRQVGKELGVRYILEGSVRTGGNRVRVTAQLIDALTGNHIWAERYDRVLADFFDLQSRSRCVAPRRVPGGPTRLPLRLAPHEPERGNPPASVVGVGAAGFPPP